MSPDIPWGGARSDARASTAVATALSALVEPLHGVRCERFGRDGQDAVVLRGQVWRIYLMVDSGLFELFVRRDGWAGGRADAVACLAVPRRGDLGSWARRQAAHAMQVLTCLEGGPGPKLERMRLLLIDDEALMLSILGRTLGRRHEVHTCTNPFEALDLARDGQFDGVLCDFLMPGMDGREWLETMRAIRPDLARRTCLMTAEPERLAGATELVLAKPMDRAALDDVLRLFAVLKVSAR